MIRVQREGHDLLQRHAVIGIDLDQHDAGEVGLALAPGLQHVEALATRLIGQGAGGMMATSMLPDGTSLLLGGESLMDGPIARSIPGKGNAPGEGMPGSPTASIDPAAPPENDLNSARRTSTPGSSTLLLEYENIADAYFRRLTTKP